MNIIKNGSVLNSISFFLINFYSKIVVCYYLKERKKNIIYRYRQDSKLGTKNFFFTN